MNDFFYWVMKNFRETERKRGRERKREGGRERKKEWEKDRDFRLHCIYIKASKQNHQNSHRFAVLVRENE